MARKPSVSIPSNLLFHHEGFRWVNSDGLDPSWEADAAFLPFLKTLPTPQRYLAKVAPDYGWARLLLAYGKRMPVSPHQNSRRLPSGKCYANSFNVRRQALNEWNGNIFHYAEGIGITPNGAELHAWNNIANHVFDPTWPLPHTVKYFGITFTDEFLQWLRFATGRPNAIFLRAAQTATYIDNFCRTLGKGGLRT